MQEWKTYTLKDLSKGKGEYGIGASAIPFDKDKLTYLRITDINDDGTLNKSGLTSVDAVDASKYLLEKNDIVFARTGNSTGRSYFYDGSDGPLVYAGFLIRFRLDDSKVNPRILKYYSHSKPYYDWVQSFDTGGTRGNINAKTYGDMPITLPPRHVQDRIVDILYSLDAKIENNRRINDNLEQQAHALYKSWFVDYEPFLDGEFVESELGLIPRGWQCIMFSTFLSESKAKTGDIGIKEFSVTNNGIFPRDAKYNKSLSQSSAKNKLIKCGDLVFGMSRDILNWGVMQEELGGVSSAYTVYNINSELVNSTYLELFIKSRIHLFSDLIRPAAREGQGIDKSVLQTKVLLYPPQEVLDTFWPLYNSVINQIQSKTTEIKCLGDVRDTLLPKLMSGELKINEIDC